MVEIRLGCGFFTTLAFHEAAKLADLLADSGYPLHYRFEFQCELSALAAESFHLEVSIGDFSLQTPAFAIHARQPLFSLC